MYRNGGALGANGWVWNPYFGTFTFVPMSGFYNNFWGYRYWSPVEVYSAYMPRRSGGWYSGGGGGRGSQTYTQPSATSTGTSGVAAKASTAAPRASSPAPMPSPTATGGGGRATGRGR
jgi:hypothetical protein